MNKDNVIDLKKPEPFIDDPISTLIRHGARKLLAQALETEIELFTNQYVDLKDQIGRQRIVRNGYRPQREIQSGIGPVPVKNWGVYRTLTAQSRSVHPGPRFKSTCSRGLV